MKIDENGIIREMTKEEVTEYEKQQKEMKEMMANMPPTNEERIAQLEAENDELYLAMADMLGGNL